MHKLVVDSSVWIDFFNKKASFETGHLKSLLTESPTTLTIIILPVIMQEILQGIADEKLFIRLKEIWKDWNLFITRDTNMQSKLHGYTER